MQDMLIVNEGGLYRLIMRSTKDVAERFQDWVTDDLLPTLRKDGSYSAVTALPQTYADALRALATEVEARELADAKVAELEPAAEQFRRWQMSEDTVHVVEWAKCIGLTQPEAFKALRELGVLFKQQHEGVAFNVPKRQWEKYFDLVQEWLPGPKRYVLVPKITSEGQVVLAELLLEHGWIAP
jgi:phage antirepressor YoqD-like protein